MRSLLKVLGLVYDPDKAIKSPYPDAPQKQDTPIKQDTKKLDLVYTKGVPYVQKKEDSGYQWDRYTGQKEARPGVLSEAEKAALSASGLDTIKGQEIKLHWSNGLSAKRTAGQFQGKRGYGVRTVEKYFSVFNAPQSSR